MVPIFTSTYTRDSTMSATKDFTKGQKVVFISEWNRTGTYTYRRAIVHACGNKQMTLIDAKTGEMMGRNYAPTRAGIGINDGLLYTEGTWEDISDEEAIALCEKFAAESIERNREFYTRMINDESKCIHYRKSIQKSLNALHEPRGIEYHEACEELAKRNSM